MYSRSFKDKVVINFIKKFKSSEDVNNQIQRSLIDCSKNKDSVLRLSRYHFPNGFDDVLIHFAEITEAKLIKVSKSNKTLIKMRLHEKIIFFILERFKILTPFKNSISELLVYIIKNARFLSASKLLFKISDQTWYLSGDKSLDFNFYTKRAILIKVYIFSLSFWLRNEDSQSLEKTKNFTEKIIKKVLSFGKIKSFLSNNLRKFGTS